MHAPPKPQKKDMQVTVGLAVLEEDEFLDLDLRGIEILDFLRTGFSLKTDNVKAIDQLALGLLPLFPLVEDDLLWFHRSPRNCYVHKIVGWSSGLNGMLPGIQAAMQAPNWHTEIIACSEAWRWKISFL